MTDLFEIRSLNVKYTAMIDEQPHKVIQAHFRVLLSQFNRHFC